MIARLQLEDLRWEYYQMYSQNNNAAVYNFRGKNAIVTFCHVKVRYLISCPSSSSSEAVSSHAAPSASPPILSVPTPTLGPLVRTSTFSVPWPESSATTDISKFPICVRRRFSPP